VRAKAEGVVASCCEVEAREGILRHEAIAARTALFPVPFIPWMKLIFGFKTTVLLLWHMKLSILRENLKGQRREGGLPLL
jgi:hypothetical protein